MYMTWTADVRFSSDGGFRFTAVARLALWPITNIRCVPTTRLSISRQVKRRDVKLTLCNVEVAFKCIDKIGLTLSEVREIAVTLAAL